MPVPIFPPVTIDGWRGKWIVLGPAHDKHGGNVWVVKATAGAAGDSAAVIVAVFGQRG